MTPPSRKRTKLRIKRHHAVVQLVKPGPDGRCHATGKLAYPTRALARVHIKRLRAEGRRGAADLQSYRCKSCGSWHVGHKVRTVEL